MANAKRDENRVETLMGITDDSNQTPTNLVCDSTTKRLKVSAIITSGGGITSLNSQTGATQTFTNDTNVTIVSAADAHVITWSGQLAVARGGTGSSTSTGSGSVVLQSSPTLTTPRIANGGYIADANGNEEIIFNTTASAVNEIAVTNAATGTTGPLIAASGETNVDLRLSGKGTGAVHNITGTYGDITSYSPSAAGTATLTLQTSNIHFINMPAGNITIALSNEHVGQCFMIRILQDGTGSRTVTWFTTIKWAGGSAPTLTTTASKADMFGFVVRSAGNYDGFVVGQNL